jgi:hypothetical protein
VRVAFLSLHSHGDRSFLDDNRLALSAGRARRAGHAARLVVAALDAGAPDVGATPGLARLVAALADFDAIVYERVWSRAIRQRWWRLCPALAIVHWRGEHALDDPPGTTRSDRALPDLLAAAARARAPAGARAHRRQVAPGLGALAASPATPPVSIRWWSTATAADRALTIINNPAAPTRPTPATTPCTPAPRSPPSTARAARSAPPATTTRPGPAGCWPRCARRSPTRAGTPAVTRLVLRDQQPLGWRAARAAAASAASPDTQTRARRLAARRRAPVCPRARRRGGRADRSPF